MAITGNQFELRHALVIIALVGIGVVLVWYVLFQARFLINGPQLTLTSELPHRTNERIVNVTGTARNSSQLTLNGREIFVDTNGNFSEPLVLENGYTIMTVRAEDRYGREAVITESLVYEPVSRLP